MKRSLIAVYLILIVAGFTSPASAQSSDEPDSAAIMELQAAVFAAAQPGPEHELLASLVGEWNQEIKFWMAPGAESMVISGICTNEMILGGRFLTMTGESEYMGQKSEGYHILGFDRRHEIYTMVSFDTWGTYYITASGTYDDSTKAITMSGEDDDPIIGHTQKFDMIVRFVDENTFVMEIIFTDQFHTKGGDPFKMVEITFTRK